MERTPHRARALLVAALAAPVLLAAARDAAAQTPAPVHAAEAQARFNHGRELFVRDQFAPALAEFRASLGLYRSPNTELYVGLCLARLERNVEAYDSLTRAATDADAAHDPRYAATATRARNEAASLEPRVARLTVRVDHPVDGLTVRVEGDALPSDRWNSPVAREPGEVTLSAGAPGYQVFHRTVRLAAGGAEDIAVDLTPVVATPSVAATPPAGIVPNTAAVDTPLEVPTVSTDRETVPQDTSTGHGHGRGLRLAGWITGGAGVLGLVGFVVFGELASSRYSDVQGACHDAHCPASYGSQIDGGVMYQTVADVSLGVGLGLLAAGATMLAIAATRHDDAPPPEHTSARLDPWVDPTHGTLGVRGAF